MTTRSGEAPPRFLTDPHAVIAEAVGAADPGIAPETVAREVVRVADTRAKQRRLAQALSEDPGLLSSGRPEGPRLVEDLIRALLPRGANKLVLPRCAGCGQQRRLSRTDGTRRMCSYCGAKAAGEGQLRLPCGVCGKSLKVVGWDSGGRPRCQRHPPGQQGEVAEICVILHKAGVDLVATALKDLVAQVLPLHSQQRGVLVELIRRPELLTGEGAHGSPRVIALIDALLAQEAQGITAPACPFCHRLVKLKYHRDKLRCCRSCYDEARMESCSGCERPARVNGRTPEGGPLCCSCVRRDPVNHELCAGCGRLAPSRHDTEDKPWCRRCWRDPLAVCSVCGILKPCHFGDTDTPRCPSCTARRNTAPCSLCGNDRVVWARTADGGPLCERCSRGREPCSQCSRTREVYGRTPGGGALCKVCYPKHPISFRECSQCGSHERLHHHGICPACAATRQLRTLLTGPDGILRPPLEQVAAALAASPPSSLLLWLGRPSAHQLLGILASGTGPVTHAVIDKLPRSKSIFYLRAALVAHDVLPARDEYLATFEHWLPRALEEIPDPEERVIVKRYGTWFHLRNLRRRARRRPLTQGQLTTARHDIRAAMRLLNWLHEHGTSLATCTQADIDVWLSSGNRGRVIIRNFMIWCSARGYCQPLEIPVHTTSRGQEMLPEADQRWTISRRLLTDTSLDTADRVAGCLVVLYGQLISRIAGLTTDQVNETPDGMTLALGSEPLAIPEPLAGLIRELVRTRRGYAALGHTDAHRWLFPGARAGRPMSAQHLGTRLNRIGLRGRAGRNSALLDLAAELPAVVLSNLLGIHVETATAWATEAGNTRPAYAAELARRHGHRTSPETGESKNGSVPRHRDMTDATEGSRRRDDVPSPTQGR
ncbi:hypothetical protein [Streptomyces sp. NPDC004579]|uniref:hypothetical protein n=1 Tax=Streptomyces sp. NPDC004579 TaxID=3154667 RepID=UPI0033AEE25C